MKNINLIMGSTIKRMLTSNAGVVGLVGDRIYMDLAPGAAARPYVLFAWAGGGFDNMAPGNGFDVMYTVTGVSGDMAEASKLGNYIAEALLGTPPNFPDGVSFNAPITGTDVFHDSQNVQNVFFWRDGMVYRFRGMIR